jgi:hypothetical protein
MISARPPLLLRSLRIANCSSLFDLSLVVTLLLPTRAFPQVVVPTIPILGTWSAGGGLRLVLYVVLLDPLSRTGAGEMGILT